jgi:hypothetical protein
MCLRFKKKISPKTFGLHCVYSLKYGVGVASNDSILWGFVIIRPFFHQKLKTGKHQYTQKRKVISDYCSRPK